MNKVSNTLLLILSGSAITVGGTAQAADVPVASFSYNSTTGSYTQSSATTGVFNAAAVSDGTLTTAGDFNRLLPAFQNAAFPAGFVNDANFADIQLTVNVTVTSAVTALGVGQLTITDIDGDQFTTGLSGIWIRTQVGVNFNASMVNPTFIDNGAQDGTFNGYAGGWSTNFNTANLTGASVSLVLSTSGFFNTNYVGRPTGISGQILPTPGTVALAMMGLAAASGRR